MTGLNPDYVITDDPCRYPLRRYTSAGQARCAGGFTEKKCRCAREDAFFARLFRKPKQVGFMGPGYISDWRLRVILPAHPCWKGEIQVGPFVIWWQA